MLSLAASPVGSSAACRRAVRRPPRAADQINEAKLYVSHTYCTGFGFLEARKAYLLAGRPRDAPALLATSALHLLSWQHHESRPAVSQSVCLILWSLKCDRARCRRRCDGAFGGGPPAHVGRVLDPTYSRVQCVAERRARGGPHRDILQPDNQGREQLHARPHQGAPGPQVWLPAVLLPQHPRELPSQAQGPSRETRLLYSTYSTSTST